MLFFAFNQATAQTNRSTIKTSNQKINIEKEADSSVVYLFNNYQTAIAYYGKHFIELEINYRLLSDEIIALQDDSSFKALVTKDLDSIVTRDSRIFVFRETIGFLEKTSPNSNLFFIKYRTTYTLTELKPGAYGNASPTASTQSVQHLGRLGHSAGHSRTARDFYLDNPTGNDVQIDLTSKPILILLHDNQFKTIGSMRELIRLFDRTERSEIRNYIKDNNIAFDNRNSLVQLSRYIEGVHFH